MSIGRVADSTTTMPSTSGRQSWSTSITACTSDSGSGLSCGLSPEEVAQALSVAEVGEPRHGPPGLGTLADPALEVETEVGQRGRPHAPWLDHDAGARQARLRLLTASPETSVVSATPVHRSHRPQCSCPSIAGSSSWSRRNHIRHRSVSR